MSQLEILLWVHSSSLTKCSHSTAATHLPLQPPICHFTWKCDGFVQFFNCISHIVIRNKVANGWRFDCFKGIVDPTDCQLSSQLGNLTIQYLIHQRERLIRVWLRPGVVGKAVHIADHLYSVYKMCICWYIMYIVFTNVKICVFVLKLSDHLLPVLWPLSGPVVQHVENVVKRGVKQI